MLWVLFVLPYVVFGTVVCDESGIHRQWSMSVIGQWRWIPRALQTQVPHTTLDTTKGTTPAPEGGHPSRQAQKCRTRWALRPQPISSALTTSLSPSCWMAPCGRRRRLVSKTRQDKTREEKTRQDKTRHVTTRQDLKRHDKRKQDKTSNIHLIIQIII